MTEGGRLYGVVEITDREIDKLYDAILWMYNRNVPQESAKGLMLIASLSSLKGMLVDGAMVSGLTVVRMQLGMMNAVDLMYNGVTKREFREKVRFWMSGDWDVAAALEAL